SVSDSRRRVANDLFNRLTHKNADRFRARAASLACVEIRRSINGLAHICAGYPQSCQQKLWVTWESADRLM
ncbi:hypothetical protein, partial [Burkholderia ubonensis]|uniref:hypothetical protein n=1 Tax=Burkholderia ubonensis TaxID=101571 RepID=UPI001E604342